MLDQEKIWKPQHPQTDSVRSLGIMAIVFLLVNFFCGCGAFISIILGVIAYKRAKGIINEFSEDPGKYHLDSLKAAENAKTMGLVGAILGGLITLATIIVVIIVIIAEVYESQM